MIDKKSTFVICSSNPNKLNEISTMLSDLNINLKLGPNVDIPEDGNTFMENAIIKALGYSELVDDYVIAEDSGFCVENLNYFPGIYSARFSACDIQYDYQHDWELYGIDETLLKMHTRTELDLMNNKMVLDLMYAIKNRTAFFEIALVVARKGEIVFTSEAKVMGKITTEIKGKNGFCYDPIFISDTLPGLTYGEVTPEEKNKDSHRYKVLQNLKTWLSQNI